jgi:signal transduction histidine kinase
VATSCRCLRVNGKLLLLIYFVPAAGGKLPLTVAAKPVSTVSQKLSLAHRGNAVLWAAGSSLTECVEFDEESAPQQEVPESQVIKELQLSLAAERQEKTHLQRELAQAVAQRNAQVELCAAVAHDLRNPMTAIKAGMTIVNKFNSAMSLDQVQVQLSVLKRQVDRMDRLLKDFLDITLLDTGRFEMRLEITDLREAVRASVELFKSTVPSHSILFTSSEEAVPVNADPDRIEQIVNNLVSNAIKYSPGGGTVRVDVNSDLSHAVVSVNDDGVGISESDLARIFQPFQRLGTRNVNAEGFGLGLYMARRLVEAHGGKLEVESVLGKGSSFRLVIPRYDKASHAGSTNILKLDEPLR